MNDLNKLKEKQVQVQADLEMWAAENLLPDQQLLCTLEVIQLPKIPKVVVTVHHKKAVGDILVMQLNEFFTPERLRALGANQYIIHNIRLINGRKPIRRINSEEITLNTIADLLKFPRKDFYISYVGKKSYETMAKALEQVGITWE